MISGPLPSPREPRIEFSGADEFGDRDTERYRERYVCTYMHVYISIYIIFPVGYTLYWNIF